jgi:hypothetical protein
LVPSGNVQQSLVPSRSEVRKMQLQAAAKRSSVDAERVALVRICALLTYMIALDLQSSEPSLPDRCLPVF